WYVMDSWSAGRWLSGGSAAGLTCGVVAGLIIVFEMLLSPKKWARRFKFLLPAKYWMAAHLWLGIASLPLAIAHSGMTMGGWLPATFLVLFILTIVSGVFGWCVQSILPKWMLRHLPAETIYGQIDHVSEVMVEDARYMLVAACGPKTQGDFAVDHAPQLVGQDAIIVGAQRTVGRTVGRTAETRRMKEAREDSEQLWTAYAEIKPFLEAGASVDSPVSRRPQAAQWFERLRSVCGDASQETINTLEKMCDQRRQFDTQQVVHRLLHGWLPIHIGLSVAVLGLLIAHVWTALKYW
ncbi:MAG: hypothetical protein MI861_04065, partial [Pirellulales bacterium]|nr:hypothetical protein [Pirellulales bacterium]